MSDMKFALTKFENVYTLSCSRLFAEQLASIITEVANEKAIAPAIYSFAKQLEFALREKDESNRR